MAVWGYDRTDVVCPHCGTRFRDEIFYIKPGECLPPKFCPECGQPVEDDTCEEG